MQLSSLELMASPFYTFYGETSGDSLGCSVSGLGDINGDGYGEVIMGSHRDNINGNYSGHVRVISANQLLDVAPEIVIPENELPQ